MKMLFRLALQSAWNRRLTLGLTLLAVVVASCLLLAVERVRHDARESFSQSVSGTDLIVGTRSSALQLVLYAVFHQGDATGTMNWRSYQKIAADPAVAWAVPLALGDSHQGFPVLGTTSAYFEHFRHGFQTPLQWRAGRPFQGLFEAVIGAELAQALGYRVGQQIVLSHGSGHLPGLAHEDKPFTIVGILATTGTPVDRTVHISLQALEAIHLDWYNGIPLPELAISAEEAGQLHLEPRQITAMLVGLHQRGHVFALQRRINSFGDEPLQAVLPGIVLDQLWQTVGMAEQVLQGLSWLMLLLGLSGMVAVILAGLGERRRELAILRSVGASPRQIAGLLLLETAITGVLGALLGLLLLTMLSFWAGSWLSREWGLTLHTLVPVAEEWLQLGLIITGCALVGLIPAWQANRMILADGLTPRL